MADKKQHIDELLRDALGEYTEQPPIGAWANMEAKLDDSSDVDLFFGEMMADGELTPPADAWTKMEAKLDEKRPRGKAKWYWMAAALLGLLVGSYVVLNSKREHKAVTEHTEVVPQETAPMVNTPVEEKKPAETVAPEAPIMNDAPKVEAKERKNGSPKVEQQVQPIVPKTQMAQQNVEPKTAPEEIKQDAPVANGTQADKTNIAKQEDVNIKVQPMPTPEIAQTPAENKATDPTKDDVAEAMKNRQTDVLMNIKRSAYLDSVAAAEQKQKEEVALAAVRDSIAQAQTPEMAKTEDTASATAQTVAQSADTVISEVAKKLQEKVQDKIDQQVTVLTPVQDAIVPQSQAVQAPPDKLVFTDTDAMKQKMASMEDNGTDKGSLAAFIGPMEDTVNYEMEIAAIVATPEVEKVREPIQADVFFKAGFERGFDQYSISKFVIAPSFEFKLADKLSLMLQPAIKVGATNRKEIGQTRSYHDVTSSQMDSNFTYTQSYNSITGVTYESINAKYYFREIYDSVVVSHSVAKRAVVQVDMPLMLSYRVANNVSVYGGPVVTYSSVPKISTQITRYQGCILRDTVSENGDFLADMRTPSEVQEGHSFEYNTSDYKDFDAAPYANPTVNKLKVGAMAGMSMNLKNKVSVDLSLMQNFSGMNYIPNAGVRNLYLQPYVRFMVGYKLNGKRK
jgi:hypothetical protein